MRLKVILLITLALLIVLSALTAMQSQTSGKVDGQQWTVMDSNGQTGIANAGTQQDAILCYNPNAIATDEQDRNPTLQVKELDSRLRGKDCVDKPLARDKANLTNTGNYRGNPMSGQMPGLASMDINRHKFTRYYASIPMNGSGTTDEAGGSAKPAGTTYSGDEPALNAPVKGAATVPQTKHIPDSTNTLVVVYLIPLLGLILALVFKKDKDQLSGILLDIWNIIKDVDNLFDSESKTTIVRQALQNSSNNINIAKKEVSKVLIQQSLPEAKQNKIKSIYGSVDAAIEKAMWVGKAATGAFGIGKKLIGMVK